jgi:hypothetical protein
MIFLQTTSRNRLSINSNTDIHKKDWDRILLFLDAHVEEGFHLEIQLDSNAILEKEVSTELNNYLIQNQDKVHFTNHFLL